MQTDRTSRTLLVLLTVLTGALAFLASQHRYWFAMVGTATAAGVVLVALWTRNRLAVRDVLFLAVVFRLLCFWLPPVLSDDMYRYVWDGMLQAEGINPFLHMPSDPAMEAYAAAPIFRRLNSADYYTVYPPMSQVFFAVGGWFYDQGWQVSFYVIKALMTVVELAGVLLLARCAAPRSLALYALNPLVVLAVAGQGHTEGAMAFFLVLAVWCSRRGKGGWAAAALACAGWVKLYPLVLFPFLWRRHGWKAVWPAVIVSVVLWTPYADWRVPANMASSLDLYVRYFEFNAGFYYTVKGLFRLITGEDWSKQLGPAFRTIFLLVLPVLYLRDARRQWPLEKAFIAGMVAFFLLATTVHPWYLLGVYVLLPMRPRVAWSWWWLSVLSIGTYLKYVDGPYWTFVTLGWAGWLVLTCYEHPQLLLQPVQQVRAWRKWRRIRALFPRTGRRLRVLDLGAGEGYVGAWIARALPADVVLADVLPMNRTRLPYVLYDGRRLPFPEALFDASVLYFVLHHAQDQRNVLQEALRVAKRVIIVESVYERRWDLHLLRFLDRWANRVRSGGRMRSQEAHLRFRTAEEWEALFRQMRVTVHASARHGRWLHKQVFFVLEPLRG